VAGTPDRLVGIRRFQNSLSAFAAFPAGHRQRPAIGQVARPLAATNYSCDILSRLTSVLHQLSGTTIDGASYRLDAARKLDTV